MTSLLLLLLACSDGSSDSASLDSGSSDSGSSDSGTTAEPTADDLLTLWSTDGPHGVGYTEQELSYTDPAGQPRSLRLAVWYPSPDTDGEPVQYLDFVDAPGVMRDATIEAGSFPVVVYSHGHQGYAEASGFLMAHLASHGWLVASPDHTDNTTFDGSERTTEIYFQRPADISAVIDHLDEQWADTADLDTIVGLGHSFGGYTMHALAGATYDIEHIAPGCYDGSDSSPFCSTMSPAYEALFAGGFEDDRIDAILPMGAGDVDLFASGGFGSVDVPGLWVAGELDGANDLAALVFDEVQGGPDGLDLNRRVEVLGADHNFCIDLTAVLDIDATIDDQEGFRIAKVLASAWAARHGLGLEAADPLLDGELPVGEAAVYYR